MARCAAVRTRRPLRRPERALPAKTRRVKPTSRPRQYDASISSLPGNNNVEDHRSPATLINGSVRFGRQVLSDTVGSGKFPKPEDHRINKVALCPNGHASKTRGANRARLRSELRKPAEAAHRRSLDT